MSSPRVLVVGGAGSVGRLVIAHFKRAGWATVSADLVAQPEATQSVTLDVGSTASPSRILSELHASPPLDAVVSVAGAWHGGGIEDSNLIETADAMWWANVVPSLTAAHVASRMLRPDGLLMFTGALPVRMSAKGTPWMVGYSLSKAAVHNLVVNAAAALPEARVVGLLPQTIDTPANREAMPTADFASWTPASTIAEIITGWAGAREASLAASIQSGGLYAVTTEKGETKVELVE